MRHLHVIVLLPGNFKVILFNDDVSLLMIAISDHWSPSIVIKSGASISLNWTVLIYPLLLDLPLFHHN